MEYLKVYLNQNADNYTELTEKNKPKNEYIVLREGRKVKVEESDIVVGDMIYLKAGIRIPTDGFFLVGNSLIVNESTILGENQNIIKKPLNKSDKEQSCPILLSHTNVING